MSTANDLVSATFAFERETKGALLYVEIGPTGVRKDFKQAQIGTIYLRKDALKGKRPAKIQVIVQEQV